MILPNQKRKTTFDIFCRITKLLSKVYTSVFTLAFILKKKKKIHRAFQSKGTKQVPWSDLKPHSEFLCCVTLDLVT